MGSLKNTQYIRRAGGGWGRRKKWGISVWRIVWQLLHGVLKESPEGALNKDSFEHFGGGPFWATSSGAGVFQETQGTRATLGVQTDNSIRKDFSGLPAYDVDRRLESKVLPKLLLHCKYHSVTVWSV